MIVFGREFYDKQKKFVDPNKLKKANDEKKALRKEIEEIRALWKKNHENTIL